MRIGLFIGAAGPPGSLGEQVQQVVDAERNGFDSVWFAQVSGFDVLTVIALAGQQTQRIELGTAVVPIISRHPNVLAQQSLTVQAAIGGRLTLGIGVSHRSGVEERLGLSYDQPAVRMREYLSVLRPLITEGRVDFSGRVLRVATALQPLPGATPFPIMVAALAPLMLRIAGELADGTITWMVGPTTLASHIMPRITAAARDAGRPAPRICVGLPVAVSDDPVAARERAAHLFGGYGQLVNYRRMLDHEGVAGPADIAVVGDEAAVAAQLNAFAGAGATDLLAVIFPADDDTAGSAARTRACLRQLIGSF